MADFGEALPFDACLSSGELSSLPGFPADSATLVLFCLLAAFTKIKLQGVD
jgi:hypothetical protein